MWYKNIDYLCDKNEPIIQWQYHKNQTQIRNWNSKVYCRGEQKTQFILSSLCYGHCIIQYHNVVRYNDKNNKNNSEKGETRDIFLWFSVEFIMNHNIMNNSCFDFDFMVKFIKDWSKTSRI